MEKDPSMTNGQNDPEAKSKPDLNRFEHIKLGVWDLYIMRTRLLWYLPIGTSCKIEEYTQIWKDIPYLRRAVRDMNTVAWFHLSSYLVLTLVRSLIPALSLWLSGEVLRIVQQSAIDKRAVDVNFLIWVAGGRALCTAVDQLLYCVLVRLDDAVDARSRKIYWGRIFRSMARLDVPTWNDPAVSSHISSLSPSGNNPDTVAWSAINVAVEMGSAFLRLFSEAAVLFRVLQDHGDGALVVLALAASEAVSFITFNDSITLGESWAAVTRDRDYIRMEGLKRVVNDAKHRKELVVGGLDEFLTEEYCSLADRLRGRATELWAAYYYPIRYLTFKHTHILLKVLLQELPQIIFTLQVVKKPASITVSLASFHLLQRSISTFASRIQGISDGVGSSSNKLSQLRKIYEAENIPNKVKDGMTPFPENAQSICDGISLEFRDVSFRYPGSEQYALRGVSFKVLPGQLCVIVGSNGSGKSTILKLVARIYDPTEGSIHIDGQDIKTLKLADLRRAMAILFQDYTHFPLSIRDNIAMGNPRRAHDDAAIEEAARLGGASELIARLPEGLDTYLEWPVSEEYQGLDTEKKLLFKEKFACDVDETTTQELSGGQMQRLAVARTFMRSSTMEDDVGLLMFDEPSAALDPTAEHDLFSRFRNLRGRKSMIFLTHRFGNLTRHADIILYMNDSAIVEFGTHEELLKHSDSDYGRLWRLQAEAFL